MRWGKAKPRSGRDHGATGPPPTEPACLEAECALAAVTRCSYQDRQGRICVTSWCPGHAQAVAGQWYCRRHATIMRPLSRMQEVHLPNIDNRAPGLAQWVADCIDGPVTQLLRSCMARDETFLAEPLGFVHAGRDGLHRWERSWKIISHIGVNVKVVLEADEERDGLVCLRIGHGEVARLVPPWIDRREEGEELTPEFDRAERAAFYGTLVEALRVNLIDYFERTGSTVPPALFAPLSVDIEEDRAAERSWFLQLRLNGETSRVKPLRGLA